MKLYAYHGLYYYFNDEALVKAGFLSSFSDQEKNTIYSDPNFGLNNVGGLYYWFKAAQNSTDSLSMYYRKAIMVYFTSKNVKMSQAQLDNMLGPKSIITMIIQTEDETAKIAYQNTDTDTLSSIQWVSREYVSNPAFALLDGVPPVVNLKDLDPANILFINEYDYFVKEVLKATDLTPFTYF